MSSSTSPTTSASETGHIEIREEHLTYEWVIKDAKLLLQKGEKYIISPMFGTINNGAKWALSLYPQYYKDENNVDYVAIFLHLMSQEGKNIEIKVDAEVSIAGFSTTHSIKSTYKNEMGYRRGYGPWEIMQKSELLKLCDSDDSVTIRIVFNLCWKVTNKTKYLEEALNSQEGRWSQDFERLWKGSKFSDVVVIVGNQKFPAHKLVLAARSPVFSAMFENKESQENLENEVKIEDMEPAVVEAMLEFFYTDKVANLDDLACGLLGAAEKYDIPRLKIMCEKVLYKTLNKENAAEILMHADLYRLDKLKEHVMEFMDDHLFDVVKTEGYKEMKNFELLKEFICSVGVRKGPKK